METVNKVAQSGLMTLDLESLVKDVRIDTFDIKDHLHMEYVLREDEFRATLDAHDWSVHAGRHLAVTCTNDAIVASWAFMLVAAKASGIAADVRFGTADQVLLDILDERLQAIDWNAYAGKRVLVKGCSTMNLPQGAYVRATARLVPVADRVMYGEACSFVPVWRRPKV
jgi:hypothetical protein